MHNVMDRKRPICVKHLEKMVNDTDSIGGNAITSEERDENKNRIGIRQEEEKKVPRRKGNEQIRNENKKGQLKHKVQTLHSPLDRK